MKWNDRTESKLRVREWNGKWNEVVELNEEKFNEIVLLTELRVVEWMNEVK